MALKLSFFVQILLSWSATLPLNLVNTEACPLGLVPQPTRPVFESVNADTCKNFWPFPLILDSPPLTGLAATSHNRRGGFIYPTTKALLPL
ncbi:hypothetical protein MRX96_001618 [Rhipicephalus microplus]